MRLPIESSYSHLPIFLPFCSNPNSFSGSNELYSYVTRMWVSENQTKILFYFSRSTKTAESASSNASGNKWLLGQLVLQIDCLLPHTEVQDECVKNIHVDVKFCNPWISHFVLEFVSIFGAFLLCTSQPISCQSSRVGGFLTAFSLGFILLMKFLLSFFFYSRLLLFQHIRSVGRQVGITFCAKDIRSIRCLKQCEESLASVTGVL